MMIMIIYILEHGPLKVCDSCLLPLQQSFKLEVRLPSVQKYNLIIIIIIIIIIMRMNSMIIMMILCINVSVLS